MLNLVLRSCLVQKILIAGLFGIGGIGGVGGIGGIGTVAVAEPLPLARVLEDLSGSPRLKQSESAFEEASWKRVESYGGFLPTVSVGADRLLDKKYLLTDVTLPGSANAISIPGVIPTTTYSLSARWTVFDGFSAFERWRSAKLFESSARADHEWTKFKSERELILLYYRALASKTLREVAEQNVKVLEDHLNDTKLFKRAGISTNFDLLRVEVQLSEAQSEVANARDGEIISVLKLGDLTNQNYEGREVIGALPVVDAKFSAQPDASMAARKDLESLADRAQGLLKASAAAGRHWVPRVNLYAQYQYYNNRTETWMNSDDFRDARTIGVQLAWPLFEGLAPYARGREAQEQKAQAEYALAQMQSKARTDLEFWKRKLSYFSAVYRARSSDVAKATESVRLAREGRKVGSRTNTDLLDAESELFRARAGLVNSQIGAIESLINLELATGRELHRFQ